MVQWFCLISWRLFEGWTSFFGIMSQCDTTFDLKINVGHRDLYFMVQWFWFISWRMLLGWTSFFGIISQCDAIIDLIINVGHSDLHCMVQWVCLIMFYWSPVILPYKISWLFEGWAPLFGIMSQWDAMIDLIINVGHSILHCMVQWFCLILLCWSPVILPSRSFVLKNILVLLAKQDSGELCCPVTALITVMCSVYFLTEW